MNFTFGIIVGVFLSFAGTSFYKFTLKTLKERKADHYNKLKEMIREIKEE